MLWFQVLLPAAGVALLVRLDAIFVGPYWSWLQLIPDPGQEPDPKSVQRLRRRALARRIAIPGVMGFGLRSLWPDRYGPIEAAGVCLLAGVLLLWPLIFAEDWHVARRPRWMALILYGLLLLLFTASGYLGGIIGSLISESGGLTGFIRTEGVAVVITAVIILFVRDGTNRVSDALQRRRREELDE